MFSWYKYLIANLIFFHLGIWSGNHFLIAPFSVCLYVVRVIENLVDGNRMPANRERSLPHCSICMFVKTNFVGYCPRGGGTPW